MKTIMAIAASMLLTISGFAQSGKGYEIYNKYSDCKNVSAVYISSSMFRLMGSLPDIAISDENVDFTPIIKSLSGMYLIESENPEINTALKDDVMKMVSNGSYELMMEAKEDDETVHIYTSGAEYVTSFVLLAFEKDECTFISIEGKISREDMEKLLQQAMSNN